MFWWWGWGEAVPEDGGAFVTRRSGLQPVDEPDSKPLETRAGIPEAARALPCSAQRQPRGGVGRPCGIGADY